MTDDLNKPLGLDLDDKAGERRALPWLRIALGFGAAGLLCLALFLGYVRDPFAGQPTIVAEITTQSATVPAADTPRIPAAPAEAQRQGAEDRSRSTAAELEADSGVKVVRSGGRQAPSAVILRVPDETPAIRLAAAPDRRLVEKGKHGALPRVGDDGARPADVYARAQPVKAGRPRIAIMVTGLGIGQTATENAVGKLPGAVTLAFAPYGGELERNVARARSEGHEVILQVPMEPFDYPDNDPGPHTLTTTLSPDQNLDRMHWLMSRFPGYIGFANHMGAKFTADSRALSPVLREAAKRGLIYVEDGMSSRSLALELAPAAGVTALRGDLQIDLSGRPADIDAALAKLEALARTRGHAVGVGAALPSVVERISRWAAGLEARGIDLVPVSAIAATLKRTG